MSSLPEVSFSKKSFPRRVSRSQGEMMSSLYPRDECPSLSEQQRLPCYPSVDDIDCQLHFVYTSFRLSLQSSCWRKESHLEKWLLDPDLKLHFFIVSIVMHFLWMSLLWFVSFATHFYSLLFLDNRRCYDCRHERNTKSSIQFPYVRAFCQFGSPCISVHTRQSLDRECEQHNDSRTLRIRFCFPRDMLACFTRF